MLVDWFAFYCCGKPRGNVLVVVDGVLWSILHRFDVLQITALGIV